MPLYMQTKPVHEVDTIALEADAQVRCLKSWTSRDGERVHLLIEAPAADVIADGADSEMVEVFGSAERWMAVEEIEG